MMIAEGRMVCGRRVVLWYVLLRGWGVKRDWLRTLLKGLLGVDDLILVLLLFLFLLLLSLVGGGSGLLSLGLGGGLLGALSSRGSLYHELAVSKLALPFPGMSPSPMAYDANKALNHGTSPAMSLCPCTSSQSVVLTSPYPPLSYCGRLYLGPCFGYPGHMEGWLVVVVVVVIVVVMAYLSGDIRRSLGLDGGPRRGRVDNLGDSVPEAHFESSRGEGEKSSGGLVGRLVDMARR